MASDIDHIDPQNGFFVSGLTVPQNLNELDRSLNRRKGNSFLPYKGSGPVEPGEFHWFLDPDTEDWVFEEFLGTWWWEKTRPFDARSKKPENTENYSESNRRQWEDGTRKKHPNFCGKPWKPDHPKRTWDVEEVEKRVLLELQNHNWSYHWGRGKLEKELNISRATLKRIAGRLRKQWKHS